MNVISPEKRKKITDLILRTMVLDPTGKNVELWRQRLEAMSDVQMYQWLEGLKKNEDEFITLQAVPYLNEPTLDSIEKAAKVTGTKLHQYVYFRHDGAEDDPIRSQVRVPVGMVHVRRLQQLLAKKTSYSTDASKRSQLTGQLSGDDAVGRVADEEAYALKTVGAEATLREVLGPRADNRDKRLGMYQAIERDGFVNYGDLKGDVKNQATLNYMNTLLIAAGLKTDLVDATELLRVTADRPVENQRK